MKAPPREEPRGPEAIARPDGCGQGGNSMKALKHYQDVIRRDELPFEKHRDLIVRKDVPFNAGPPLDLLRQSLITPNNLFFVRNHGNVPEVDPESYRLLITGL